MIRLTATWLGILFLFFLQRNAHAEITVERLNEKEGSTAQQGVEDDRLVRSRLLNQFSIE